MLGYAVAESCFATLEHELLATVDFHSHHEAEHAIAAFIDYWYNPVRRHSTLGYVSPMHYVRHLRAEGKAAQPTCPFLWVKSTLGCGAGILGGIKAADWRHDLNFK